MLFPQLAKRRTWLMVKKDLKRDAAESGHIAVKIVDNGGTRSGRERRQNGQTFDGDDLYPSLEEKAANLLYFVTKNHSFSDGNKRIAAFLFLYFLERNGILFDQYGNKRIADNTLVALTLMIAVSNPSEKETMVKVIVNLINRKN